MPPTKPSVPPAPPPRNSWLPLVLVLGLLAFVLAMSFMLAGIELTLAIVGIIVVLGGAAAFHYVVWGWWLSRYIREDVEAEKRELKTTDKDERE
jgi:hypothetical protein